MNRRNQRRVDIVVIIGLIIVLVGCIAMLSGCASTSDTRSAKHTVIQRQEHVVIPTTGEVVAVTNTEERWEDSESHTQAKTAPDVEKIVPAVAAVANVAAPGLGIYVEAGLTLLAGTMTAWGAAKHREAASHKADADEGWKLAVANKPQNNQGIDHA